jgi:uncharacterized protein YabN with tetrapyrrole methylase and pyrophosphatase domain
MDILKKLTALENAADHFGFKWEYAEQIMVQIKNECVEVSDHLKDYANPAVKTKLQEEIGDLMHAVFSLCVFCQLDAQETLANSVTKFERRFNAVKELAREQGLKDLQGRSFEELMLFWDRAKQLVG